MRTARGDRLDFAGGRRESAALAAFASPDVAIAIHGSVAVPVSPATGGSGEGETMSPFHDAWSRSLIRAASGRRGSAPALVFATLAALTAVVGAAQAQEPAFSPSPDVVDHIVEMKEFPISGPPVEIRRTVTRRASASRVDTVRSDRPGRTQTTYFDYRAKRYLEFWRDVAGQFSYLFLSRRFDGEGLGRGFGHDGDRSRTGETKTFAGETCDVWEVSRSRPGEAGFADLRCLTADGIELWRAFRSGREVGPLYEAVKIERRQAPQADLDIPSGLLDGASWGLPSASDRAKGYVVTFGQEEDLSGFGGRPSDLQELRARSGRWIAELDVYGVDQPRLTLRDVERTSYIQAEIDADGTVQVMTIRVSRGEPTAQPPEAPLGTKSTILEETCRWFDMMPGMMDAGETECRTGDGLPLKINRRSFGSGWAWTAASVRRGDVSFDELGPIKELLSPAQWGLR